MRIFRQKRLKLKFIAWAFWSDNESTVAIQEKRKMQVQSSSQHTPRLMSVKSLPVVDEMHKWNRSDWPAWLYLSWSQWGSHEVKKLSICRPSCSALASAWIQNSILRLMSETAKDNQVDRPLLYWKGKDYIRFLHFLNPTCCLVSSVYSK